MWKKGRTLAACVLAAAWWSLFYPELCFTEETCRVVQTAEEGTDGRNEATPDGKTRRCRVTRRFPGFCGPVRTKWW